MPVNSAGETGLVADEELNDGAGTNSKMPRWDIDEEIVISGLSGRFPESDSIDEFKKNLFDGVDLCTVDGRRWKPGLFGIPTHQGKIKDITRFDAIHFGVHAKQANTMDPQLRMLLEVVYEAVVDSGYSAQSLRGKTVGVFMAQTTSETEEAYAGDIMATSGYALIGCCRAMLANRVAFCFDFRGPSYTLDASSSSSLYAFHQALISLRSNLCEAAIVGAVNVTMKPTVNLEYQRMGLLSSDGKTRTFDALNDGFVRSEAVSAVLLQRASHAKRVYATVMHSKVNSDGISYSTSAMQTRLLREAYSEANIHPKDVSYVEASGNGTVVEDTVELDAISDVLLKGRTEPLLIGSVNSNMGNADSSSGLCAVAKAIVAMEEGFIPPNLHFETPNPQISGFKNGKLKVVQEKTPLPNTSIIGVSDIGLFGNNAHVILKSNPKDPYVLRPIREIPRLVTFCGRTEEATEYIAKKLENEDYPDEALVLLEDSSKVPTYSMPIRCYALLKAHGEEFVKVTDRAPINKRPVWFLFTGMGSQWAGMAKEMMQLKSFAESIHNSAKILEPFGMDLAELVMNGTDEDLGRITASFVTIAAVQIALVDLLRDLELTPDGIVGHSVGELGCSYADGCFTAEQMLMCAYWRGKCCELTELPLGLMAATGLTWEEAERRLPEGVIPACHNAEDSVTISGPQDKVREFLAQLRSENVFAREVKTCDIAFHSHYLNPMVDRLKKELSQLITNPKPRSSRWISSSIPESEWGEPLAKMSSWEYHVNNLLSPVLFHDALSHVPSNAIVIEVAPHGLLQAIVKRRLGTDCIYVSLMKRKHPNNIEHFLSSIGKLYNSGLTPTVKNLYEPIAYPVPRGTPSIASLVKWDHSTSWATPTLESFAATKMSTDFTQDIDCSSPDSPDYFVTDHSIDERCIFPPTGYLVMAWKTVARKMQCDLNDIAVVFEKITFHRFTIVPKTGVINFKIFLRDTTGEFKISVGDSITASGIINIPVDPTLRLEEEVKKSPMWTESEVEFTLDSQDIYKEMRLRGYDYGAAFQGVAESESNGLKGKLRWDGNWVVFMDSMIQFDSLNAWKRGLYMPTRIQSLRVDPKKQPNPDDISRISIYRDPYINVCTAGAVEIEGLSCDPVPRRIEGQRLPVLEEYKFVFNDDANALTQNEKVLVDEYTEACSTLARKILEASGSNKAHIREVLNGFTEASSLVLKRYLEEGNENYVLLKTLKEILDVCLTTGKSKDWQETVLKASFKNGRPLNNDILSTTLLNENTLRSTVDLVVENTPNVKSLRILEAAVDHSIASRVHGLINKYHPALTSEYTIGKVVKDSTLDTASLGEGVKTIKWDLDSKEVPSESYDLVIANGLCATTGSGRFLKCALRTVAEAVKDNGFIILIERTKLTPAEKFLSLISETKMPVKCEEDIETACKNAGLTSIAKKGDGVTSTMYLLRKQLNPPTTQHRQTVMKIDNDNYGSWVETLKSAIQKQATSADGENLWLVADKANVGIVGLVNCLRKEIGGSKIRCVFNANQNDQTLPEFKTTDPFFIDVMSKDLVMNGNCNGQWGSLRHFGMTSLNESSGVPTQHAYLNCETPGDFFSLKWTQSPLRFYNCNKSYDGQRLCHVYYSPVNAQDIQLAIGKLQHETFTGDLSIEDGVLGLEFAGREDTPSGRRVMGLVQRSGLATTVESDPDFLWTVPDSWTLEEASTVPVAYTTAYYALIIRGGMKKHDRVLVHSGSGAVGQAAISIALSMGCEVFTTVGSKEKRDYLKKRFPKLQDRNICNSRDESFEIDIKRETDGKGVSLVLNSLADEKLQASVRCVSLHGRFLEIGHLDISNNNPLGMSAFLKNITFHGVSLDSLFDKHTTQAWVKRQLVDLVKEGIENGTVRPLDTTVFRWDQVEDAFRFMTSGKQIGKVVIKVREEENVKEMKPSIINIPAIPKSFCHPDKTYIITGGLGGFGLEFGTWLVNRGCKKLVVTSRTGARSGYQNLCLKRWKQSGVQAQVSTRDASTKAGAEALIKESMKLGPIGGVFNLAMVLRDASLDDLTPEDFSKASDPKYEGTAHLDQATRSLSPDVEWFVAFSSVSSDPNNADESKYGFSNSVMERVCEQRQKDGLPGLAIQWGALRNSKASKTVDNDILPRRIKSCLATLDHFLQIPQHCNVGSCKSN